MAAASNALVNQIPEAARIRLGRVIRHIVDDSLRYGDGSGESTARAAFDALSDKLDPDHKAAMQDASSLLAAERDAAGGRPA